jgi:thymidine phosphorylase
MDTREIGLAVVALGGGRRIASETIDARVGLSQLQPLGARVAAGQPLMLVHAASRDAAHAAMAHIARAVRIAPRARAPGAAVIEKV